MHQQLLSNPIRLFFLCLIVVGFSFVTQSLAQQAATGFIQVKGEPGLRVMLNGDFKGLTTAAEQGLILQGIAPGTYELRILKEGSQPQTTQATVRANEVFVYEVRSFTPAIKVEQEGEVAQDQMRAEVGSLLIRTVPVDAIIEIPDLGINARNNGTKTRPDWRIRELPTGEYPAVVKALEKEVPFTIKVEMGQEAEYLVNALTGQVTDVGAKRSAEEAESKANLEAAAARVKTEEMRRLEEMRRIAPAFYRSDLNPGDRSTITVNGVEFAFRWIPPGTFIMGSPSGESGRFENESPQTTVNLSRGFWMGETPVTQAQWMAVAHSNSNPSRFKGDNLPVERVTWNDIMGEHLSGSPRPLPESFIARLNESSGLSFSLPTEAQWEYACRAGTSTRFHTGDSESDLAKAGWYAGNSNFRTRPVGMKTPNAWGLYDMHGNVWEWCLDLYTSSLWGDQVTDPVGSSSDSHRVVLRGGYWGDHARYCRSAARGANTPSSRSENYGFRLALVP